MSYFLSPVFGAGSQFFSNQGVVLAGGKIFTYVAGSSTLADTYTTKAGLLKNTNPIVLDSAGRPTQEIWLEGGVEYKFVVTDSLNNILGQTWDYISGVNDTAFSISQWQSSGYRPTFVSGTTFTTVGDSTAVYQPGRRLRTNSTTGYDYGTVQASAYASGVTTVTVINDVFVLDSGLSTADVGLITPENSSIPTLAFAARLSSSQGMAAAATTDIVLPTVDLAISSGYDNTTGIFTASVSGAYSFTAGLLLQNNSGGNVTWGSAFFSKNNQTAVGASRVEIATPIVNGATIAGASNYFAGSGSFLTYMSAGDTMRVKVTLGGTNILSVLAGSNFCGSQIH